MTTRMNVNFSEPHFGVFVCMCIYNRDNAQFLWVPCLCLALNLVTYQDGSSNNWTREIRMKDLVLNLHCLRSASKSCAILYILYSKKTSKNLYLFLSPPLF